MYQILIGCVWQKSPYINRCTEFQPPLSFVTPERMRRFMRCWARLELVYMLAWIVTTKLVKATRLDFTWGPGEPKRILEASCGSGPIMKGELFTSPNIKNLLNRTTGIMVKAHCNPPEAILWVDTPPKPVWVNPFAVVQGLAEDVTNGNMPQDFKEKLLFALDDSLSQSQSSPDEILGPPPLGCFTGPFFLSPPKSKDIAEGLKDSCIPASYYANLQKT
ncbi:membrane glycoprotein L [Equid alphaherpesvirus 1]|uniref:Membrane glycoprotein L n=2 Tax=Equid alphaherpesvirus 1 TaxID=10326 RepID=A0A076JYJ0_9ALPH|nr:membrane glycoprotein L [Equid alphaherpesvirus 1]AII81315.1 membrane glycoprotein L [Equid alphaherpesvirus 1]AII81395.1 membrane glycoprotein L [Equid alphaherpesvirus 1]AII81793.1 membrane glycoprotein L [Equid alphaherpesvirus 1]